MVFVQLSIVRIYMARPRMQFFLLLSTKTYETTVHPVEELSSTSKHFIIFTALWLLRPWIIWDPVTGFTLVSHLKKQNDNWVNDMLVQMLWCLKRKLMSFVHQFWGKLHRYKTQLSVSEKWWDSICQVLWTCGSPRSALFTQSLKPFFLDNLVFPWRSLLQDAVKCDLVQLVAVSQLKIMLYVWRLRYRWILRH